MGSSLFRVEYNLKFCRYEKKHGTLRPPSNFWGTVIFHVTRIITGMPVVLENNYRKGFHKQIRDHIFVMLCGDKLPILNSRWPPHSLRIHTHRIPGLSNTPSPVKVNNV